MNDVAAPRRWTPGAKLWFLWMIGMWAAFWVLLVADELDGLWSAIRDLPFLVELGLWLPFFPWSRQRGRKLRACLPRKDRGTRLRELPDAPAVGPRVRSEKTRKRRLT